MSRITPDAAEQGAAHAVAEVAADVLERVDRLLAGVVLGELPQLGGGLGQGLRLWIGHSRVRSSSRVGDGLPRRSSDPASDASDPVRQPAARRASSSSTLPASSSASRAARGGDRRRRQQRLAVGRAERRHRHGLEPGERRVVGQLEVDGGAGSPSSAASAAPGAAAR